MSRSIRFAFTALLLPVVAMAADAPALAPLSAIPGVIAAGTSIEVLKEGFEAVEGPVPLADGGVLFTNNKTNVVVHIAPDGSFSNWMENTGGANALTRTPRGDVVATLVGTPPIVALLKPGSAPQALASGYEGKAFNRPNDIIASKRGDIYFTDTAAIGATAPPLPSAVYRISATGELKQLASDIARPNGVALSPDEKTLFVANTSGEWIIAFELDARGDVTGHHDFAKLALPPPPANAPAGTQGGAGADGVAVDEKGRLFVATTIGVQVISPQGEPLGVIVLPKQPQNLAFSGPKKGVLYVVGRGTVYRINTLTHGPDRDRK